MKNRWIAALLLGMAFTAGAQQKSAPMSTIYVEVVEGRVTVSPAGMRTPAGETTITWWVRTAGYRFARGGVNFGDAGSYFSCSVLNEGQGVRCVKSEQAPAGEIPYSVRVQGNGETVGSDPGIFIATD